MEIPLDIPLTTRIRRVHSHAAYRRCIPRQPPVVALLYTTRSTCQVQPRHPVRLDLAADLIAKVPPVDLRTVVQRQTMAPALASVPVGSTILILALARTTMQWDSVVPLLSLGSAVRCLTPTILLPYYLTQTALTFLTPMLRISTRRIPILTLTCRLRSIRIRIILAIDIGDWLLSSQCVMITSVTRNVREERDSLQFERVLATSKRRTASHRKTRRAEPAAPSSHPLQRRRRTHARSSGSIRLYLISSKRPKTRLTENAPFSCRYVLHSKASLAIAPLSRHEI